MNLPDFSKIFHQASKDHSRGHPPVPGKYEDWPEEWKTTYYKAYPRLPKIDLEDADLRGLDADQRGQTADFFDLIKERKSHYDFTRTQITKHELSILLKYSCGNMGILEGDRHRRAQPSGGGRFPIEIYPVVFRHSNDLKAGLYHYNVKDHQLDVLWDREFSDDDIGQLFTYPWVKRASTVIVMTAVFWRMQNKYGERGYRHILLEAGHIGQNIYLVSEALGIKCCALSGTWDENLEKLIDIDGVTESVVYAVALGK